MLLKQGIHQKLVAGAEYTLALLQDEDGKYHMGVRSNRLGSTYHATPAPLNAETEEEATTEAMEKFKRFLYIMGDDSQQ